MLANFTIPAELKSVWLMLRNVKTTTSQQSSVLVVESRARAKAAFKFKLQCTLWRRASVNRILCKHECTVSRSIQSRDDIEPNDGMDDANSDVREGSDVACTKNSIEPEGGDDVIDYVSKLPRRVLRCISNKEEIDNIIHNVAGAVGVQKEGRRSGKPNEVEEKDLWHTTITCSC